MTLIQAFLRSTPDGVAKLKELYAIDAKRHTRWPNLVLFKYNQIDSPLSIPLVREARGIILDEADNWNCVCYAFPKFFNYGETHAAEIDWSTARVQEKIDGSLCQLYWYDGEWQVATSGTPDASSEVNDFGKTFAGLFWETAKNQKLKTWMLNESFCWIFELTSPYNQVVVQHQDCKIWTLGARCLKTLLELDPGDFFGGYTPKSFPLKSLDDCVSAAVTLDPLKQEGFVVVDKDYRRIKVKSPAYVMLHHAKDTLSRKRICDIVRNGEYEEFRVAIEAIPTLKAILDEIKTKHDRVIAEAINCFDRIRHIENQKEFAMEANKSSCPSVLFYMRKEGLTAGKVLASERMTLNNYMRIIGEP
jgi:hypothetical protein